MKQGMYKSLGIPVLGLALLMPGQAAWADEPYIGEVRMFAYDFCPKHWLEADGRTLPIENYMALYALYGITYGGDGMHNFVIPDLRGRVPVDYGHGPGRSPYRQGQTGGVERIKLTVDQLPIHSHEARSSHKNGKFYVSTVLGDEAKDKANEQVLHYIGGYKSHQNLPPYQAIRYCVAYEGIYPPRN